MYQKNFPKGLRSPHRALFFSVIVIFTLFLFFSAVAQADEIGLEPAGFYRVIFNDYELGYIDGQFNWTSWVPVWGKIEQRGESYDKVLNLDCHFDNDCRTEKDFLGLVSDYDFLTINVEIPLCPADRYFGYNIILKDSNDDWFFLLNVDKYEEVFYRIQVETLNGNVIIDETFDATGSYNWYIDLDKIEKKFRVKNDFGDWSEWYETMGNRTPEINILRLRAYGNSWLWPYFDDIELESKHCSNNNCELCLTKDGCDYNDKCIWDLQFDICKAESILTQCGPGTNLRFCETQAECEMFDGIWEYEECLEKEGFPITDFETWYDEQVERFDEPTNLALKIANFANPVFRTAGNIITTFENKFKLAQAYSFGIMFGEVVPKARGFIKGIDDFFGGLPIGEGFLVFLSVSLVVIIIRVIFKLLGLIKP